MSKTTSDGSTASYYELPKGCTELQQLISHRDMNAQIGEIFRACYRYGIVSHSPKLRDAKKIKFYIEAEIERLEALALETFNEAVKMPADFGQQHVVEWPADETRADLIGQNGNDGLHYAELEAKRKRWEGAPEWATVILTHSSGDGYQVWAEAHEDGARCTKATNTISSTWPLEKRFWSFVEARPSC